MTKKEKIDDIFNILIQYEKIKEENSGIDVNTYQNYLDRLSVWYTGYGNEEIACGIKGLYYLGDSASHETVKRMVFHIIDILDKEE